MNILLKANFSAGKKEGDKYVYSIHIPGVEGLLILEGNSFVYEEDIRKEAELNALKKLKDGLEFNHKFGGITGPQIMEALKDKIKELEGKKNG